MGSRACREQEVRAGGGCWRDRCQFLHQFIVRSRGGPHEGVHQESRGHALLQFGAEPSQAMQCVTRLGDTQHYHQEFEDDDVQSQLRRVDCSYAYLALVEWVRASTHSRISCHCIGLQTTYRYLLTLRRQLHPVVG